MALKSCKQKPYMHGLYIFHRQSKYQWTKMLRFPGSQALRFQDSKVPRSSGWELRLRIWHVQFWKHFINLRKNTLSYNFRQRHIIIHNWLRPIPAWHRISQVFCYLYYCKISNFVDLASNHAFIKMQSAILKGRF